MVLTLWYYPKEGIFKDLWGRVVKYWNEMFNLDVIAVIKTHKRTVCFDDPIRKDRLIMHYAGGHIIPLVIVEYDLRLKAMDEWFSIGLFVEETDPVRQEYLRLASQYENYFGRNRFPWSFKPILEDLVERPCIYAMDADEGLLYHTDLVRTHEALFFEDGTLREMPF